MTNDTDPRVSRRYRELGAEEPPHALDEAILLEARRAAEKRHAPLVTPVGRHRWYFGLAAAAALVLAVAVTVHVEREQPDGYASPSALPAAPSPVQPAAPKTEPAPEQPAKPQSNAAAKKPAPTAMEPAPMREPEQRADTPAADLAARQERARAAESSARTAPDAPPEVAAAARPAPPSAPKPEAPAAPELSKRSADFAMESRAREEAASSSGQPQRAPAPMAAPAPAAKAMARDELQRRAETPEQELERIAELRRQQRHEDADKALAEFRKRHPDYKISGPMLERVERR